MMIMLTFSDDNDDYGNNDGNDDNADNDGGGDDDCNGLYDEDCDDDFDIDDWRFIRENRSMSAKRAASLMSSHSLCGCGISRRVGGCLVAHFSLGGRGWNCKFPEDSKKLLLCPMICTQKA